MTEHISDPFGITVVTPENVTSEGLFCIKNQKTDGFRTKRDWYQKQFEAGFRMRLLKSASGKTVGFVESSPAEVAWRPVHAPGYDFVHCIYVASKADRRAGGGRFLLDRVRKDAEARGRSGVVAICSDGAWIADRRVFESAGFTLVDERERYQLMGLTFNETADQPFLPDWTLSRTQYVGWHLVYAYQCPWHAKAIEALTEVASQYRIDLQLRELVSPSDVFNAPSGFGVFSLIRDGKLLADHYISATRFKNILNKELA